MTRCKACNGPLVPLGVLGNREHYRCRNCGLECSQHHDSNGCEHCDDVDYETEDDDR